MGQAKRRRELGLMPDQLGAAVKDIPPIPDELAEGYFRLGEELNQPGGTLFDKVSSIYAYLEKYNEFVATFAVCEQGCNACCSIDVSMTRLEAEMISLKTGHEMDRGSSQTRGHRGKPCTFLAEDGSCSVYDVRPFNCRTFHTLDDPKYCSTNIKHVVYGSADANYNSTILAGLAEWLGKANLSGGFMPRDIRDWFPA